MLESTHIGDYGSGRHAWSLVVIRELFFYFFGLNIFIIGNAMAIFINNDSIVVGMDISVDKVNI